jgi:hypothetical protein
MCPARQYDWYRATLQKATQSSIEGGTCQPAIAFGGDHAAIIKNALADPTTASCLHLKLAGLQNAISCVACAFGAADQCFLCGGEALANAATSNALSQCVIDGMVDQTVQWPTEKHWVDMGGGPIPLVGLMRTEVDGTPVPASSHMTKGGDYLFGGAHQGNDWNWSFEAAAGVDPLYQIVAWRMIDHPGVKLGDTDLAQGFQFMTIENELEFTVPLGAWTEHPAPEALVHGALHGHEPNYWLTHMDSDATDYLGQIVPNEHCNLYRLDLTVAGAPDGAAKADNPSYPTGMCGVTPAPKRWVKHYGRGLFAPLIDQQTLGSKAQADSMDGPNNQAPPLLLGLQNWSDVPHRLAMLGSPIVDCGHSPYKLELHPPRLLLMDLMGMGSDGHPSASIGQAAGLVYQVFGWTGSTGPKQMAFDLWPPPRPSAAATLVVEGASSKRLFPAAGVTPGGGEFGYVIDPSGPQHDPKAAAPTLSCAPAPAWNPNHLHCTYRDDSASVVRSTTDGSYVYANALQTPYFASSRFDARLYVGWQ